MRSRRDARGLERRARARARKRRHLGHHVVVARLLLHRARRALHVHRDHAHVPARATASIAPGARNAFTSFTTAQPARDRRAHHLGLHRVDGDRDALARRAPRPPASRARSSSFARHRRRARAAWIRRRRRRGPRPRRAARRPCSIARAGSRKRPPSEKESGVTLTMPITSGARRRTKGKRGGAGPPLRRCVVRPALRRSPPGRARAPRRGCRRRWAACGLRGHRLRRARRAAVHDVLDLVRVDRLPLEQRLGHHLDLVAVLLEQARARARTACR